MLMYLLLYILLLKNFSTGLFRVGLTPDEDLVRKVLDIFLARRRLGVMAAEGSRKTSRAARRPIFPPRAGDLFLMVDSADLYSLGMTCVSECRF